MEKFSCIIFITFTKNLIWNFKLPFPYFHQFTPKWKGKHILVVDAEQVFCCLYRKEITLINVVLVYILHYFNTYTYVNKANVRTVYLVT